ncbi:MAG: hypothetical protein COA97_07380 [Flavobacteriales bacterium]|nr:MAG: hypothetical protein COA97_07380 [Flavobacteriales bacterium]
MKSNKIIKPIITVLSTVVVLFLAEFFLQKTMKSVKYNEIGKINYVMEKKLDVELSIWGSSTALVNFDPKIIIDSLGFSAFNMGINGTNIDQYNGLLLNYLNYTENSKYLIIAIDIHQALINREEFFETYKWLHHFGDKNIYNCHSDIDKFLMKKNKYIPFYSITQYDKHGFPYFRSALFSNTDKYSFPNLGYLPNGDMSLLRPSSSGTKMFAEVNKRAYRKLLTSCLIAKEKNITPIVIITPCFTEGLKNILFIDEYKKKVFKLKNKGVVVFDFLDTYISKNPKYFKDNTHMNNAGAEELTKMLIQNIKKIESRETN